MSGPPLACVEGVRPDRAELPRRKTLVRGVRSCGGHGFLAVMAIVAVLAGSAAEAAVEARFRIVPGESLGPLRLGMTRSEARQVMLKTFRASPRKDVNNPEVWCWLSRTICAGFLVGKGTVVTVSVERDQRFATVEGVRVGMDGNEALRRITPLGTPRILNASDGAFVWWPGLQMTVKYGGAMPVITSIMVSPKP